MENYFWFYSTVAQVFAAIWAVTGMFAVFRLELLDRKIKDALRSLLNFMLVSIDVRSSFAWEYITQLENIKQHVIEEIEESDKKEYFELDPEILLNKVKETKYIIRKHTSHLKKLLEDIDKQKKEKKELTPEQGTEQRLTEKIIKKYYTLKNIYDTECNYKDDLTGDLKGVIIVDGLVVIISVFVLFFLKKPLLLKVDFAFIQVGLLLISITAIILSAKFILDYCKRR